MKYLTNIIHVIVYLIAGSQLILSQIPVITGTIKKDGTSCIGIFAKPSNNVNIPPSNYVFSVSIPDQNGAGESNPTITVTELLPGMQLDLNNPLPYTSGRRYYDCNITAGTSPPAVNWTGGSEYKVARVCFSSGTPFPNEEFIQVNELASYGNNGYTDWYFEFQGLNGEETTPVSNPYYASPGFSTASNGSDSNAETLQGVSLPIRLLSFHASKASERSALLQWTTTSEINSDFFDIERSTDGISWETIGNVKAAGYSQEQQEYMFLDDALPLTRSELLLYYRLRLVDADGRYDFSEVKGVNFRSLPLGELSIYPNPAYDMLHVDFTGMEAVGPGTIEIYDNSGKSVFTRKGDTQGILLLDITDFAAGTYYVNYSGQAGMIRKSFIKVQR